VSSPGSGPRGGHHSDPDRSLEGADVAIDFKLPGPSLEQPGCWRSGRPLVWGPRGTTRAGVRTRAIGESDPGREAPNMSWGEPAVRLAELAARALGDDYDAEIVRRTTAQGDAPSGTALGLGEAVGAGVHGTAAGGGPRPPRRTGPRPRGAIGFAVCAVRHRLRPRLVFAGPASGWSSTRGAGPVGSRAGALAAARGWSAARPAFTPCRTVLAFSGSPIRVARVTALALNSLDLARCQRRSGVRTLIPAVRPRRETGPRDGRTAEWRR